MICEASTYFLVGAGDLAQQIYKKLSNDPTMRAAGCLYSRGYEVIPPPSWIESLLLKYILIDDFEAEKDHSLVPAIGYSDLQGRLQLLESMDYKLYKTIILNSVHSISHTNLGVGVFIDKNVTVDIGAEIQHFTHLDIGVSIGENCLIGEGCYIANSAIICGSSHIGSCSFLGAGSIVYDGVKIGRNCKIGAGSLVQSDVPDNTLIFPQQKQRVIKIDQ